jgi:hypothetical protein
MAHLARPIPTKYHLTCGRANKKDHLGRARIWYIHARPLIKSHGSSAAGTS